MVQRTEEMKKKNAGEMGLVGGFSDQSGAGDSDMNVSETPCKKC